VEEGDGVADLTSLSRGSDEDEEGGLKGEKSCNSCTFSGLLD
jgi:hypothetical protein